MRRSVAALVVALGSGVLAAACGGAASPPAQSPEAPASVHSGDASGPEGTLAELDAAERQIFAALGGAAGAPKALGPTGAEAKKENGADAAPKDAARSEATATAQQDPCTVACSALGSMKRATERLCGLTGEDDERCTGAKGRVGSSSERVRASCPACTE